MDMVAEGNCVALLFEHHVAYPIDSVFSIAPPFAVVPITPKIQTTLYWGYLKNHTLSATAEHFIDYCTLSTHKNRGTDSVSELISG